jgi:acylphosphatase
MAKFSARRYLLMGRVQGVGCRAQVLEIAEGIGHLAGYVRNLTDGRVEVRVKGPDWRVADFERALRESLRPPVRIEGIESEDLPTTFTAAGFVVGATVSPGTDN